jgi:hypothetical protein
MGKKQPAHEIKLGTIRATIWANVTKDRDEWFSVNISRRYKNGDAWQETHSLRRDDLPIAVKAMDMAYGWLWRQAVKNQRVERSVAGDVLANAGR